MSTATLKLSDAAIGYHRAKILTDLNLMITAAEICLITGPNGSGKTTLGLSMLGALPLLWGQRQCFFHHLSYVPQNNQLDRQYPITLKQLVTMGDDKGNFFAERKDKADQVLNRVGLEGQENLPFSEASGGQMQRSLIARALMHDPDFILLDEPFANLDTKAQESVKNLLLRLNREQQVTLVIIDHPYVVSEIYTSRIEIEAGKAIKL